MAFGIHEPFASIGTWDSPSKTMEEVKKTTIAIITTAVLTYVGYILLGDRYLGVRLIWALIIVVGLILAGILSGVWLERTGRADKIWNWIRNQANKKE